MFDLEGVILSFMNGVIIRPGEPFEKALKRFTKTCEKAGILSDLKKIQHYEKPSEKKKRKLNQARRKAEKDAIRATMGS